MEGAVRQVAPHPLPLRQQFLATGQIPVVVELHRVVVAGSEIADPVLLLVEPVAGQLGQLAGAGTIAERLGMLSSGVNIILL